MLIFIGAKMLLEMELIQSALGAIFNVEHVHIPIFLSFGIIIAALTLSIVLSLIFPKKPELVEHEG